MRLSAQTSAGCYLLEEKPSNIPLAVTQLISFPCRLLGSIEFYFFFFFSFASADSSTLSQKCCFEVSRQKRINEMNTKRLQMVSSFRANFILYRVAHFL